MRYVGRSTRSTRSIVDVSGDEAVPLLLSGRLYEILEAVPDLAIAPRFPDLARTSGDDRGLS